jgi:prephenate dehydratase
MQHRQSYCATVSHSDSNATAATKAATTATSTAAAIAASTAATTMVLLCLICQKNVLAYVINQQLKYNTQTI